MQHVFTLYDIRRPQVVGSQHGIQVKLILEFTLRCRTSGGSLDHVYTGPGRTSEVDVILTTQLQCATSSHHRPPLPIGAIYTNCLAIGTFSIFSELSQAIRKQIATRCHQDTDAHNPHTIMFRYQPARVLQRAKFCATTISPHGRFLSNTSIRAASKDSQDKDSLNPRSTEYSKSGSDDAAASSDAAFNPNKTSPEEAEATAEREAGGKKNSLNVSPGNETISEPNDPNVGGSGGAPKKDSSGGGSAPKSGGSNSG